MTALATEPAVTTRPDRLDRPPAWAPAPRWADPIPKLIDPDQVVWSTWEIRLTPEADEPCLCVEVTRFDSLDWETRTARIEEQCVHLWREDKDPDREAVLLCRANALGLAEILGATFAFTVSDTRFDSLILLRERSALMKMPSSGSGPQVTS